MNGRKERMTWKRLLSSILAVAMLITLLPIGSLSVSAEEGSNTSTASGDAITPQNCKITIVGINGDTYGDYQVLSGSNIEFYSLWSNLNNNGKSDFLYGTINGEAQIATKVNVDFGNDGTWDETWSGDGKVYTAGVYTVLSGDDNNGIVNITVTRSLLTAVPVGTTTNIIITNGQFTYNGNNYTKN